MRALSLVRWLRAGRVPPCPAGRYSGNSGNSGHRHNWHSEHSGNSGHRNSEYRPSEYRPQDPPQVPPRSRSAPRPTGTP